MGLLHVTQERQLKWAWPEPTGDLGAAPVTRPADPINERRRIVHEIFIVFGVVAQPEESEAGFASGTGFEIEAPAIH
jgi:hypothetical protein